MKKIMIAVLLVCCVCGVSKWSHYYDKKNCVVVEASCTGALLVDELGEGWYCEGFDFAVGDVYEMKMFDNYTEKDIEDDEIVEIKKVGE